MKIDLNAIGIPIIINPRNEENAAQIRHNIKENLLRGICPSEVHVEETFYK